MVEYVDFEARLLAYGRASLQVIIARFIHVAAPRCPEPESAEVRRRDLVSCLVPSALTVKTTCARGASSSYVPWTAQLDVYRLMLTRDQGFDRLRHEFRLVIGSDVDQCMTTDWRIWRHVGRPDRDRVALDPDRRASAGELVDHLQGAGSPGFIRVISNNSKTYWRLPLHNNDLRRRPQGALGSGWQGANERVLPIPRP